MFKVSEKLKVTVMYVFGVFLCVQVASVRAGRPVPSCDASDDADGVDIQTRQMIEWAMTGFLPKGPQSLDPPEGMHTFVNK